MESSKMYDQLSGSAQKQEVGEDMPPAIGDAMEKGTDAVDPPNSDGREVKDGKEVAAPGDAIEKTVDDEKEMKSEEDRMIQLEALAGNRVGAAVDAMATKEEEARDGVCTLLHLSATGERGEHSSCSIPLSGRPSPASPSSGIHLDIRGDEASLSSVRVDASGVAERSGELWLIEDPEAARAIANRVRALAASRKRFATVSLAVRWLAKHAGLPSLRPSPVGRPDRGSAVWDGHAVMLKNRGERDKKKKAAVAVLSAYHEWRHGIRQELGEDVTEKQLDVVVRESLRESERRRQARKEAKKMAKMAERLVDSREETRTMLRDAMGGEEPTEEDIDNILGRIAKRHQEEKGHREGGKKEKMSDRDKKKMQPILDWSANLARAQQEKKEEEEKAARLAAAAAAAIEKTEEKGEAREDVAQKEDAALLQPIDDRPLADPSITLPVHPLVPYPLSPPENTRTEDTTGDVFEMDHSVDDAAPLDSPVRPRRQYVRRADIPEQPNEYGVTRRERRGADFKEDNEEEKEIDWDARELEAEIASCSKPGCVKRRKEYEVVCQLANDMQEERRIEEERADRAEEELEKIKKEKEELMEMLKMLEEEQAARALAGNAEPMDMDLDGDDGVQKDSIQPAVSPPPSPVRSPVASPLSAPVRVRAAAPARSARVARVTRKMEKAKKRLASLKKLEPSVWSRHAAGPAMKKQWKTITATIGSRKGRIQRGAALALALFTPKIAKCKENEKALLTLCDTSKTIVKGYNLLVTLAKQYATEVASTHIVLGGGPRKVCQSTPEMEKLAKEFEKLAKIHMKDLHAWEKQSATLPVC